MSGTIDLLNQVSGYGILVGVGAFFAIGILMVTIFSNKYLDEDTNSTEMFMVAGRKVGVGLTASAVYSSWTWASELLWVVTMVYSYGIMASFWYGAGLAVQICIMGIVGIEAKKKIPAAHTCLEIVGIRYGKTTHLIYMYLCLVNNILSCSSMILGAAGAISIISGNLNVAASTMLVPFGVILYTTTGGLKSTFLTDYVHSFILLIILCYINTAVLRAPEIGGINGLYNLIIEHDKNSYIEGNYKGSALTGKSQGAIYFGIIHAVGDFGLTMMDSSFWQKSFSADIKASVPGYLIAAITIFANVWPLGSIVGMANIVLEKSEIFPTYPNQMTTFQVNSGFGLPFVLKAILGNGALGAILLCIYLSVTSTVSAQMISVSSIISFDIYRKYINKHATNEQLIKVSHFGVVFFGFFAAGFSLMLHYVGVDMTWLGYFYSMLICPGVIPLFLTITWNKQTKIAVILSPIVGCAAGLAVWLSTAYKFYGKVTIVTTGQQLPCLYGGLTTLFLPGILSVAISLASPYKYDWSELSKESIIIEDGFISENPSALIFENTDVEVSNKNITAEPNTKILDYEDSFEETLSQKKISQYIKISYASTIIVLLTTWVLLPLPLYRDWIWSRAFFTGWTVVSLIWCYVALLAIGIFPLYDGRNSLYKILNGFYREYIKT